MNTLIVWLLIVGSNSTGAGMVKIGTFPTEADCKFTKYALTTDFPASRMSCVKATIVKE